MYREKINKILKENVDLTSRVRQAELEISTGNVINDFAFVEEIKPDYPLIILDAIKILNGKGMVFTSGYHPQRILTLRFMVLWHTWPKKFCR